MSGRLAHLLMWADALLCFAVRRAARWTVVVVDRYDGTDYPIESVRFRWRRSADTWTRAASRRWRQRGGIWVGFEVRKL